MPTYEQNIKSYQTNFEQLQSVTSVTSVSDFSHLKTIHYKALGWPQLAPYWVVPHKSCIRFVSPLPIFWHGLGATEGAMDQRQVIQKDPAQARPHAAHRLILTCQDASHFGKVFAVQL